MPYLATRRSHDTFARKVSRYFMYRKAKRLFNEVNRDIAHIEAKMLRSRMGH